MLTLKRGMYISALLCLTTRLAIFAYTPLEVSLPYHEKGIFLTKEPKAYEYSFSLEPGQQLTIKLKAPRTLSARLWELGSNKRVKQVFTWPLQEELNCPTDKRHFILELRGFKEDSPFELHIHGSPTLLFPVKGKSQKDIISFVGDSRDEGIRLHEGLDIKAEEKTPLLAVTDGIISDVGTRKRGGKFIMLKDDKCGLHYYYAHLHSYKVKEGQKVKKGDIIGLVGDTGNARSGDFHLHFGVYDRRFAFINPYYYLAEDLCLPVEDFEVAFNLPLPFEAWAIIEQQQLNFSEKEVGFLLKKGTALWFVGQTCQGYKVLFNNNVVFLDLLSFVHYAQKLNNPPAFNKV